MRRVLSLLLLAAASVAHEVPIDWSPEAMPPGAVGDGKLGTVVAGDGRYRLTSADGQVRYQVTPGRADGSNGLGSVSGTFRRGDYVLTGGVMVAARDRDGQEVLPDGTRRLLAMSLFDLDEDGADGYLPEPKGHGPCIRLGSTLPVAAHTSGFVTHRLELPAGRYRLGLRYLDDRDDAAQDAQIRVLLDGRLLDQWHLTLNDDAWHDRWFDADVKPGTILRIEGRTDDSGGHGQDFCRISHLLLRPTRGRRQAVWHGLEGQTVVLSSPADAEAGLPELRATVAVVGRTLRWVVAQRGTADSPAGFTELTLLPARVPKVKLVALPYLSEPVLVKPGGALFSTYLDRFRSQGTMLNARGSAGPEPDEARGFGSIRYSANSAGSLNPFSETLYFTVSDELLDLLPTFPARQPTAGRREMAARVVFDHWRMAPGQGLEQQLRGMHACGMDELLVILHTWMHYGYDRKQPQFTPANPQRWSDAEFKSAMAACRDMDYRVAVHENYNHMDWDSPYNSPTPAKEFGEPDRPGAPGPAEALQLVTADPGEDLSRQPRNAWAFARQADLRVGPGPLSRPSPPAFPISSDKMLFYSQLESHKIKAIYGTTAGYLDVTPCNQPGTRTWDLHLDLDARNQESRSFRQAYRNAARLFAHHLDLFEVTTGEGGDGSTYHAGYILAVERQSRRKLQTLGLPEHELREVRPLSLHHGMGYYSRFFPEKEARADHDWDLYRALEVAFGHAGFMGDALFVGQIPGPEAFREYYLLRALQQATATAGLKTLRYARGDARATTAEALRAGWDLVNARLEQAWDNGLQVLINLDREQTWQYHGTDPVRLPPKGWIARLDGRTIAGTWFEGEQVVDLATTPASLYRHERGPDDDGLHCVARHHQRQWLIGLPEGSRDAFEVTTGPAVESVVCSNPSLITRRLTLQGVTVSGQAELILAPPLKYGEYLPSVTWQAPADGDWRVSLTGRYTDPGHPADTTRVAFEVALAGPALAAGRADAKRVSGSAELRDGFIEFGTSVEYPAGAAVGQPVTLKVQALQVGSGGVDDDYVTDLALVLTHDDQRSIVPLPDRPRSDSARVEPGAAGTVLSVPPMAVVRYRLKARSAETAAAGP